MNVLDMEMVDYAPHEIAFVSFTKKGCYEGRDRAMQKFNLTEKQLPHFRTLHSIAFREVGARREKMMDWRDYKKLSELTGFNFLGFYTDDLQHNDDKYLFYDVLSRNNSQAAESLKSTMDAEKLDYVIKQYNNYKVRMKKYDFTDIIEQYIQTGEPLPVKVAIVDEAQDLTTLQWQMVRHAFKNAEHIYIAGDDDQAIYQWSGADVTSFLTQDGDKLKLDVSHRLPSNILDYAKTITGQIKQREDKPYAPNTIGGKVTWYTSLDEVPLNDSESWLLLSRNNYYLTNYKKWLNEKRAFYYDKHEPSINKADMEKITRYKNAQINGFQDTDAVVLQRVVKKNADVTLPWYMVFDWPQIKIDYYCDILRKGMTIKTGQIHVNTIHGVKGGEADNVILTTDVTKSITQALQYNTDAELRCLYVAATRAKKHLHLVLPKGQFNYNQFLMRNY